MDLFWDFYKMLNNFFGAISKIYIFGVIPLDTTLHVIVGFLIMVIGMKMKLGFWRSFFILFVLESLKALMGAMTIDHDILHGIKEFLATFVYPFFYFMIRKIKKKPLDAE